ncbi:hypothetical protein, partial [Tritonibacter mobilis]|uniref:hypothetical protein n=1 Tax=Tritonibacter mobilis TaxID=379347 RepID=UPI00194F65E5
MHQMLRRALHECLERRRARTLGLGGGLGGVGEALMREIAGLCLVDRLLWGFVRGSVYGADRA